MAKKEIISEKASSDGNLVKPAAKFPIVGIGASAGGLAAFETFFSGMPKGIDRRIGLLFRNASMMALLTTRSSVIRRKMVQ